MKKLFFELVLVFFLLNIFIAFPIYGESNQIINQVCIVIDGSKSITDNQWHFIKDGIIKVINETIPLDGSVELTIVQLGSGYKNSEAKIELAPTIINNYTHSEVIQNISIMSKGGGPTPLAYGIKLA
ncbi:MAG: VWA domain-containing protein, partial [Candidatus Methylarchaceae archaeon HK01B]|nr:VWA domain-containing protein [Candidatus Methylarchaceae archaeon HK01B]